MQHPGPFFHTGDTEVSQTGLGLAFVQPAFELGTQASNSWLHHVPFVIILSAKKEDRVLGEASSGVIWPKLDELIVLDLS